MRPISVGFTGSAPSKRAKLLDSARLVESLGYSAFGLADHFVGPFAPLIARKPSLTPPPRSARSSG